MFITKLFRVSSHQININNGHWEQIQSWWCRTKNKEKGSHNFREQQWVPVSAGCIKLVLHVQGAQVRFHHQHVLLLQAEAAGVRGGAVAGAPLDEGPADLEPPPLLLEVPNVLAETRVLPLGDVVEAGSVVVAPGLPRWFRPAQVGLHLVGPWVGHLVLQLGSSYIYIYIRLVITNKHK